MLGSRVGNDLALLNIVQEFSEIAKATQYTEN